MAQQNASQSASRSGIGYEVTITRRDHYDGISASHDWEVRARRLSDGTEAVRSFRSRWRANRFAHSTSRLGRACNHVARERSEVREHFVLRWSDGD